MFPSATFLVSISLASCFLYGGEILRAMIPLSFSPLFNTKEVHGLDRRNIA
jgi:hypothetical protein